MVLFRFTLLVFLFCSYLMFAIYDINTGHKPYDIVALCFLLLNILLQYLFKRKELKLPFDTGFYVVAVLFLSYFSFTTWSYLKPYDGQHTRIFEIFGSHTPAGWSPVFREVMAYSFILAVVTEIVTVSIALWRFRKR